MEEGDEVEEDQVVGEAETDKAVVEIPSPSEGIVEELKAAPGDNVEVGDVIMILETGGDTEVEKESQEEEPSGEKDDSPDKEVEENDAEVKEGKSREPEKEEAKEKNDTDTGEVLALPKVRKLAEEKGVNLASIKTGERITEEEVLAATGEETQEGEEEAGKVEKSQEDSEEDVLATPSVRKLAREKEVEISALNGSGRGGKVTREDVLKAAKGDIPEEKDRSVDTDGDERRESMSQLRKTVADRMETSRFTAPHVTHFDTADVTEFVELREQKKDNVEAHLTYLPFIVKALHLAMNHYPRLNSELDEENDEIIYKDHYDFNIAVDTDRGLMTPVIRDVDDKTVMEIAEEIDGKAQEAREGNISRQEMENGTFSITNIGAIGGEEFTPIINYPQAAILGVGKIQDTAEVVDGEVKPRKTVKLSLSYDHRIVDGAEAARFMNKVIENLEDPENMILEL